MDIFPVPDIGPQSFPEGILHPVGRIAVLGFLEFLRYDRREHADVLLIQVVYVRRRLHLRLRLIANGDVRYFQYTLDNPGDGLLFRLVVDEIQIIQTARYIHRHVQ